MKYIHYFFVGILFFIGALLATIFGIIPANILGLLGFKKAHDKIYWTWAPFLANFVIWLLNY